MRTEPQKISVKTGAGFTLIEMIVSMAILISIMGLGMFLSLDYYRSYIFYYEKDLVISLLHKARSQSLANINEKKHGVRFDGINKKYTLFEEDSLGARINNMSYDKSETVALSGTPETETEVVVVFEQLNGRAAVSGGDLVLKDNIHSDIIISINNEGRISQN